MKRKICRIKSTSLLIITMLLTIGVASIGIVYAETPTRVTGDFITDSVFLDFPNAVYRGGNTLVPYVSVYIFTGPVVGTVTVEGTLVIRVDGKVNFHGTSEFDGTVGGSSGIAYNVVQGTGIMVSPFTFQGKAIVKSGTGDLENLHMVVYMEGILGGPPSGGGAYTAIYHFDP
jgi:hypothetical protein